MSTIIKDERSLHFLWFCYTTAPILLEAVGREPWWRFHCFNLGLLTATDGDIHSWRRGSGGPLPYCSSQWLPTCTDVKGHQYNISDFTSNRLGYPSRWDVWADNHVFRARADETCLVVITQDKGGRRKSSAARSTLAFIVVLMPCAGTDRTKPAGI